MNSEASKTILAALLSNRFWNLTATPSGQLHSLISVPCVPNLPSAIYPRPILDKLSEQSPLESASAITIYLPILINQVHSNHPYQLLIVNSIKNRSDEHLIVHVGIELKWSASLPHIDHLAYIPSELDTPSH